MSANTNLVLTGTGTEVIRYDWDLMTSQAFDLLMDNPHGVTLVQLIDRLEVPEHVARKTINVLRDMLADDGGANVLAVPNGRERRYQLVSETGEAVEAWAVFNKTYIESRLSTVEKVYQVLVRAAKTERDRDQARRILRQVQRLREDTQDMQIDYTE